MTHNEHYRGESVVVCDVDGEPVLGGIIVKLGSFHAEITDDAGENHDVDYEFIRNANFQKTAAPTVIKEDEKDGRKFVLAKHEDNVDGKISVKYILEIDNKPLWESEEIVTNVYDAENGWSPPDDFDTNKLELIEQMASDGFDMWVQIDPENVENIFAPAPVPDGEEAPKGKPAFAPGTGPENGEEGGEAGGGGAAGELTFDGDAAEVEEPEVGGAAPFAEEAEEGAEGAEGAPEETPEAATAASLEEPPTSFSRSIIGAKEGDDRLHGNPQHRLNPALRAEMEKKGIDSGSTNDLELSEKLKSFDYAKPKGASVLSRLEKKAKTLEVKE